MGIKQRLEYGTFFMASRRHQSRGGGGGYHHPLNHDDAWSIVIAFIGTPFLAFFLSLFHGEKNMDFFGWLFFILFMDMVLIWSIRHP